MIPPPSVTQEDDIRQEILVTPQIAQKLKDAIDFWKLYLAPPSGKKVQSNLAEVHKIFRAFSTWTQAGGIPGTIGNTLERLEMPFNPVTSPSYETELPTPRNCINVQNLGPAHKAYVRIDLTSLLQADDFPMINKEGVDLRHFNSHFHLQYRSTDDKVSLKSKWLSNLYGVCCALMNLKPWKHLPESYQFLFVFENGTQVRVTPTNYDIGFNITWDVFYPRIMKRTIDLGTLAQVLCFTMSHEIRTVAPVTTPTFRVMAHKLHRMG